MTSRRRTRFEWDPEKDLSNQEKHKASMKCKISYSNGPIEEVKVARDFLPPPEELAFREETVKVTIALSKASVEFFKQQAIRHQVSYQKMIRRLLDEYTLLHTSASSRQK
jgi:predicted DNA binding CopG/RHH family protein